MNDRPKGKVPVRSVPTNRPRQTSGSNRPRSVQPQRDPFPYIMGGVIGALVVGMMLVVFLLTSRNNNTAAVPANNNNTSTAPGAVTNVAVVDTPAATAAGGDPPRMELKAFKALYDDPAKRPLIIDVRPATAFDEGHIKGAISMPEADVDARLKELPKDKLIIAYCQ